MSVTAKHRVLHVNRVGFLGGTERVILTIGAALQESDFEAVIVCPEGELADEARHRQIQVVPSSFDRMRITANPITLAGYFGAWRNASNSISSICRQKAIEIVHVHHPVGGLYCLAAVNEFKLPLVLHVHDGPPVKALYALALRKVASRANRIICVSSAAKQTLRDARLNSQDAFVIHNAVDPSFLGEPPLPACDITGPGPHIGVFGVIEPRKGQHIFLEAASLLAREIPSAHFWIVGPRTFDDKATYSRQLEEMRSSEALRGRVTFTGHRADIARVMKAMDVVTLTSVSHETLGMVLLEALALGRPVVTSRIGATADVVHDGQTGLVVPPGDANALARAIVRVLSAEGREFGERGAADVRKRFSPAAFREALVDVYRDVLA